MAVRAPHRAASTSDGFCRFVRRRLGRRRFLFDLDQRLEGHFAVMIEAGSSRDDVAHDDVFFEAVQVVDAAHGCGFGQDARGVLEGGGAEEGLGFERSLGDAEQDGLGLGGLAAHFLDAVVFVLEIDLVDLFAPEVLGVARLGDADLAEHLADDDFDVLVVDGHALEAVDLLHFTHEVLLEFLRAADVEDLVRIDGTFGQLLALLDEVALEDDDVLADGDEVLLLGAGLRILDEDAPFAADAGAEIHDAVDLGDFGSFLGMAGFEEFGHAREAAGNVLGLGALARSLGHEGAGDDLVAFLDDDVGARGNRIAGNRLAAVVEHDNLRVQVLFVLDDDDGLLAGVLIDFLLHRDTRDDVHELHLAGFLGKNRHVVRVPLHERVAFLDFVAVGHGDDCADDDGVRFQLAAFLAENGDGAIFVQDNVAAIFELDVTQVDVFDSAVVPGLDDWLLELAGGNAAGVERAHRELGARLADGLGGNDADGFAEFDARAGGQVAAVAVHANAQLGLAGEHGADLHLLDTGDFDGLGLEFVDLIVGLDQGGLGRARILDVIARTAADEPVAQLDDLVLALVDGTDPNAVGGAAILLADNHVLGNVHQFARHVAGVGGLEGGVGQAFAGTVGGDEVLEHREALAKVGENGLLDDFTAGFGHEAAQAGELADLLFVAAGAGVDHQADGVVFALALVLIEGLEHNAGNLVGAMRPDVDDLVVTLAAGDDAAAVLLLHFGDLFLGVLDLLVLLLGDDHVVDADGDAGAGGFAEAGFLELVEGPDGLLVATHLVTAPDEIAELSLADDLVRKAQFLGPDLREDDAPDGGFNDRFVRIAVSGLFAKVGVGHEDPVVGAQLAVGMGEEDFVLGAEEHRRAGLLVADGARLGGEIVTAQRDVLSGRHDRLAAGGAENVQRGHHEETSLQLGLDGKRDVDSHLVAVEVGIVGGADQRMNADGFAFDEHWLEGLNGEPVECGGTVEQDGVALGHFLKDVPDFRGLALNHFLGAAHGVDVAQFLEAADDERLEEHERHFLRQTALVELELRPDDDDGTAGVIDALAQQVLTEAAALALKHVGKALEGAIAGAGDGPAVAAIVEQCVHGFLQHAFFVADDDFGRFELEQVFQPVVAVDDAAVEVVEVRGGEPASFQRHERTEVGRNDRQHREDHPLGADLGGREGGEQLDALGQLLADLFGLGLGHRDLKFGDGLGKVNTAEGVAHRFGAHLGDEGIGAVRLSRLAVFVLAEQLVELERGVAGIDDEVVLVIDDALQIAGGHVEHQADAAGHALEEPDVAHRHGQFDVAHALAAHAGQSHLDAAAV